MPDVFPKLPMPDSIQFNSKVGDDGVLHVTVNLGESETQREVVVTIQPVGPGNLASIAALWRSVCHFCNADIVAHMLRQFRFSLRWLLVACAALAVTFYFLFVRPTVIAIRFVSAVESGEFSPEPPLAFIPGRGTWHCREARLQPRSWEDVWQFRRRIVVLIELESEVLPYRFARTYVSGPNSVAINREVGR
jgi:hypothetical protein